MDGLALGRKASSVFVAAAVAVSLMPVPAFADAYVAANLDQGAAIATQKASNATPNTLDAQVAKKKVKVAKKKVKYCAFTTMTKKIEKKATTVKKGTTKLSFANKGEGYVKFKAPKTKKYTFKFWNLKDKRDSYSAFVMVQARGDSKYSYLTNVSTQGGKTDALWLALNGKKALSGGKLIDKNLKSRTAKLKLKKGETVYFYTSASVTKGFTMNMKVS